MAEDKTKLKSEEQLQEEQLDEVNGGAYGKKSDMSLTPEELPEIPDPLTIPPTSVDPAFLQKLYQRHRGH